MNVSPPVALFAFLFFALISVKTRVGPVYCDTSGGAVMAKFVDAGRKRNSLSRGASPERPVKFLGFARCRLAGRLMFLLLFCFFLGCHEDSSAERFSLGKVSITGPVARNNPTHCRDGCSDPRYCGTTLL